MELMNNLNVPTGGACLSAHVTALVESSVKRSPKVSKKSCRVCMLDSSFERCVVSVCSVETLEEMRY